MRNNRRDFMKMAGLSCLGVAGSTFDGFASMPNSREDINPPLYIRDYGRTRVQQFNMAGYAAPKIPTVRLGIIGLGQRGPSHIRTMSRIDGVEIKALCDLRPEKAGAATNGKNYVNGMTLTS